MQTLVDPFEIASRTLPQSPPLRDVATSLGEIDVKLEQDATPFEPEPEPVSRRASSDSSGRLRCWCSE
jgi:hypothetical protein